MSIAMKIVFQFCALTAKVFPLESFAVYSICHLFKSEKLHGMLLVTKAMSGFDTHNLA